MCSMWCWIRATPVVAPEVSWGLLSTVPEGCNLSDQFESPSKKQNIYRMFCVWRWRVMRVEFLFNYQQCCPTLITQSRGDSVSGPQYASDKWYNMSELWKVKTRLPVQSSSTVGLSSKTFMFLFPYKSRIQMNTLWADKPGPHTAQTLASDERALPWRKI